MVQTNIVDKEVSFKIVYYGIPGAGKETTLGWIQKHVSSSRMEKKKIGRRNVLTLEYSMDESSQVAGMKVKCMIHAVPSDVLDNHEIYEYFQHLDGIVFVGDSREKYEKENRKALEELENFLQEAGYEIGDTPLVFQWNKQDLAEANFPDQWDSLLNPWKAPSFSSSAVSGEGVLNTLDTVIEKVKEKVEKQLTVQSGKLSKKKLGVLKKIKEDAEDEKVIPEKKSEEVQESPKLKIKLGKQKKGGEEKAPEQSKEEKSPLLKLKSLVKEQASKEEESQKPEAKPEEEEKSPLLKLKGLIKEQASKAEEPQKPEAKPEEEEKSPLLKLKGLIKEQASKAEEPQKPKEEEKAEEEFEEEDILVSKKEALSSESKGETTQAMPDSQKHLPPVEDETETQVEFEKKGAVTTPAEENEVYQKMGVKKITPPKMSPTFRSKKPFEETSLQEAVEILQNGESLENKKFAVLDLSHLCFEKPVHIMKCDIQEFLADGTEFKNSVVIEDCSISKGFVLSKENPSVFRETLTLKKVNLSGEIELKKVCFGKSLNIIDGKINDVFKMQDAILDHGLSIFNSEINGFTLSGSQVRGPITVSGCTFNQIFSLQNGNLYGMVLCSSTQFQRVHFMNAFMSDTVEFLNCTIGKSGNFGRITCQKGISIEGCVFNGPVNFGEAYLKGDNFFRRTEFFHDASFSRILATGSILFEKVLFGSIADFSGAALPHAKFLQSNFEGIANFQESIYSGGLVFSESEFKKRSHFSRTIFLQKADFRETRFHGLVSFANMLGDYILLSRNQIEGKLAAEREKDFEMAEQEYLTLKEIFDQQSMYREKEWAHYRAKRAGRKKVRTFPLHPFKMIGKFLNWLFLDLGCGYGTRPINVIFLSMFLILLFGAGYAAMEYHGWAVPCQMDFQASPEVKEIAGPLVNSIASFLPIGGPNLTISRADLLDYKAMVPNGLIILERILGFFLIFLFTLAFFKKLLKD